MKGENDLRTFTRAGPELTLALSWSMVALFIQQIFIQVSFERIRFIASVEFFTTENSNENQNLSETNDLSETVGGGFTERFAGW